MLDISSNMYCYLPQMLFLTKHNFLAVPSNSSASSTEVLRADSKPDHHDSCVARPADTHLSTPTPSPTTRHQATAQSGGHERQANLAVICGRCKAKTKSHGIYTLFFCILYFKSTVEFRYMLLFAQLNKYFCDFNVRVICKTYTEKGSSNEPLLVCV